MVTTLSGSSPSYLGSDANAVHFEGNAVAVGGGMVLALPALDEAVAVRDVVGVGLVAGRVDVACWTADCVDSGSGSWVYLSSSGVLFRASTSKALSYCVVSPITH